MAIQPNQSVDEFIREEMQRRMMEQQNSELPSQAEIDELDRMPTDGNIRHFMDQYGMERLTNPSGPPPGYVPTPRPRQPDMEQDVMGPVPRDVQADLGLPGNLRASDMRRRIADPMTTEEELDYLQQMMNPEEMDDVPKRGDYEDEDYTD